MNNIGLGTRYIEAPNLSINIQGTTFACRDVGPLDGAPLILVNHWGAVLGNFDPRIVGSLATISTGEPS